MPKTKAIFVCRECGNEFSRWEGQCRACNAWNSLEELQISAKSSKSGRKSSTKLQSPQNLEDIDISKADRISTKILELDRVLSGGLVKGQVVLIGGTPGIGKSTLLMQLAGSFDQKVLYVSGEESESQVALRAKRLGIKSKNIDIISTGDIDAILNGFKHDLLITDSIQTLYSSDINSSAGTLSQIRECAAGIINIAKTQNIPAIIVGHITKDGSIAGPKMLEHMVDTVLYLEGDRSHLFRMLRVEKNRFGTDDEVGIFQMVANGLEGVANPSLMLMGENEIKSSGTAIAIVLEGTRPLAVEVQALTTKTAFGYPKRASSGFSLNRLQLLCAVLQKRLKINLLDQDVYVNIASGIQIKEPAVDLAVAAAIVSSYKDKAIKSDTCFFGEVGLSGEIRKVLATDRRLKEAKKLGYKNIISSDTAKELGKINQILI